MEQEVSVVSASFLRFLQPLRWVARVMRIRRFARAVGKCNPANALQYALLRAAMKRFPERKLFCPMPFKRIEIGPGGYTNLCCWIRRSPGNYERKSLMAIWNSPVAHEIRASILDGTFRYCDLLACPYFVSGNLPLQKSIIGGPYEKIIQERHTDLDSMKVWLSNDTRCNLRCISCRKNQVRLSGKEEEEAKRVMELVKQDLTRITAIGMNGAGDPFVSPVSSDFLFNVRCADYPNLKVYLLTNGQLFNRACWEKMKDAQGAVVSVQVSIDAATEKTYEKIRLGGSFDRLMENLHFLSELRHRDAIGEFIISFVANALNFKEMKMFAKMGFEFGCDQVCFSRMDNWGTFSNEEYRELAVHHPEHKKHQALKEILSDPLFRDPRIFLHNLGGIQSRRILRDSLFA